jgi:uncharacterized protein YfiM (DUF2279 family)
VIFLFSLILATSPEIERDPLNAKAELVSDSWFGEDKLHHFIHSAAISSSAYLISNKMGSIDQRNSVYISFSVGTIAGIAKEIYDECSGNGSASKKDLIYDIAGVISGILLISLGGS